MICGHNDNCEYDAESFNELLLHLEESAYVGGGGHPNTESGTDE